MSEMICTRFLNTPVPRISSSISDIHRFPMPLQKRLSKTLEHFSDPMVTKTQVGLADTDVESVLQIQKHKFFTPLKQIALYRQAFHSDRKV